MGRQIPKSLKAFTAFVDGRGMAGRTNSIKLPGVKIKGEGFRDGGMDGEIQLDMGLEAMTWEATFAELDRNVAGQVGRRNVPMTFRGSIEDENGNKEAVIAEVRGLVTEADLGEWKPATPGEVKLMGSPDYYRLRIAGREVYEIDLINGIRRINGVDQLAKRRQNLGL